MEIITNDDKMYVMEVKGKLGLKWFGLPENSSIKK
jgi:hypothetical protein